MTGSINLEWGPQLPIVGDTAVFVKACVNDGTESTCLNDPNGYQSLPITASTYGSTGESRYDFSLHLDSSLAYTIGGAASIDLDPTPQFTRNRIFQGSAVLPAGTTDPAQFPMITLDTPYIELHGALTYTGDPGVAHGVGACPSSSPFNGQTCAGMAVTFVTSGTYDLKLWPGDWRAAGFVVPPSSFPLLGIVNLLHFAVPATFAESFPALDFNADITYSNAAVENGAPNGGDGNYDGVADVQQQDVSSMQLADGSYVTIDADGTPVAVAVAQPFAALLALPPAAGFPSGLSSFTMGPMTAGASKTIYLTFQNTPAAGTEFWKYVGGAWQAFPSTVVNASPYTLAVTLVDGGTGDYDNQVNGYITDPFGLAPPFQLGALTTTTTKNSVTLSWTITAGTAPVLALPPTSSLVVTCQKKVYNLTPRIEANGAGGFVAKLAGTAKGSCLARLSIPTTPTPNGAALTETATFSL